jgi:hypothetical protein
MLTLNDGRSELWQWDTGRKLTVDADCTQVHFSNKFFGRSVDVDVFDGTAEIPDVLLQADKDLLVWAFVGTAENGYTKISKVFKVNKRNKPADYVFTPTEQTTLAELVERLDAIEENQDPDAIKNAVDEYLKQNPVDFPVDSVNGKFGDVNLSAEDVDALPKDASVVKTVNGTSPDSNGNVEITIPDSGGNVDLTGYATEQYVKDYAQPKGNYLTEVPEGYAKTEDIPTKVSELDNDSGYLTEHQSLEGYAKTEDVPTKPEDIGAQPSGNYLTEVPSGYATEEFVKNKIAEAELGGEEVDLSGYAQKSELPTKVSQLENDKGYLTEHQDISGYAKKSELPTKVSQLQNDSGYLTAVPDGYAKTEDIPKNPADIGAQPEGDYALRSEIPSVPVKSVNGKTGAVSLTATDVKARPDSWMPTASDVGALPSSTVIPTVPTKVSAFTNDAGYLTQHQDLSEYAKKTEIPSVPVKSVNGKTGAVQLSASDVKARPDTWMPSAADVGALPSTTVIPTVPTKLSAFTNDSGFITGYTETDPTVPNWAKQSSKPSYTASEVGALPSTTKIPSKTSDLTNDSGFITGYTETDPTVPSWAKQSTKPSYSKSEVGLGNVDNVKQYSASNPPPYPVTSVNGKTGAVTIAVPAVPTKVSAFTNDAGYLTKHQDISGKADKTGLTLGIHTDGLVYLFVDGVPVGTGIGMTVGGDVVGYVDENNNIVLTGALAEGEYTVKYEMEDGTVLDIGELSTVLAPTYTNRADPSSADWKTGYRLNSSGSVSQADGCTATNYIGPVSKGDVIRVKGMNLTTNNCHVLNSNKALFSSYGSTTLTNIPAGALSNVTATTTGGQCTINDSNIVWIRFSGALNGSADDVIITINEEIA